jgi:thymidylate synthase ThyX
MMPTPHSDQAQAQLNAQLRGEIAVRAARLIAEDGADYDLAKRKAARQLLGEAVALPNLLPDNIEIEGEVRKYQALFMADSQPARLLQLRQLAAQLMQQLQPFRPYLTGAVLHGTAGEHDYIHLQLFADSAKEVIMFLLDRDVPLDIGEAPHFKGGRHAPVETVSFHWRKQQVHAELYEMNDIKGALKPRADGSPHRAPLEAVRALIDGAAGAALPPATD